MVARNFLKKKKPTVARKAKVGRLPLVAGSVQSGQRLKTACQAIPAGRRNANATQGSLVNHATIPTTIVRVITVAAVHPFMRSPLDLLGG